MEERPENQQPAEFYDKHFSTNPKHTTHYTKSTSYSLWLSLIKHLDPSDHILEIACGTGRLAHMIRENSYIGLDFSPVAINNARALSPMHDFHLCNILESDIIESNQDYNTVIATEFLEHIIDDIKILKRLQAVPRQLKLLMSVPKGWSIDHVRMFPTMEDVYLRYTPYIHELFVNKPIRNRYLMIGKNHA